MLARLGFRELKWKTEQTLNQPLHPATFRKYLDILIDTSILAEHKYQRRGSKVGISLTKQARQEHKAGVLHIDSIESAKQDDLFVDEKERYRLCKLLFAINTIDNPIHEQYDTEQGILETLSNLADNEISAKDLIPMNVMIEELNNCVITYYRPISCILLIKREFYNSSSIRSSDEEASSGLSDSVNTTNSAPSSTTSVAASSGRPFYHSQEPKKKDKDGDNKKTTFYNIMLMGFSISDILARRHKGPSPIPSYELTRFSVLH